MNTTLIFKALLVLPLLAGAAHAGDPAAGKKTFRKCKACHAITAEDGTKIVKGGKTGPDLYGVIGRPVGSVEGYSYGKSIVAAGEAGIVWDEEKLAEYVANPVAWLEDVLDESSAKSKMTFKLKKGGDDVAAYLASVGPASE